MIKLYDVIPELKAKPASLVPDKISLSQLFPLVSRYPHSVTYNWRDDHFYRNLDLKDTLYGLLDDMVDLDEIYIDLDVLYDKKKQYLIVDLNEFHMFVIYSMKELDRGDLPHPNDLHQKDYKVLLSTPIAEPDLDYLTELKSKSSYNFMRLLVKSLNELYESVKEEMLEEDPDADVLDIQDTFLDAVQDIALQVIDRPYRRTD